MREWEANALDEFTFTGRGQGFVVEKIPEDITDLRDLRGTCVIIEGKKYEVTGVEMFASLDGMYRVKGPQSILVKEI